MSLIEWIATITTVASVYLYGNRMVNVASVTGLVGNLTWIAWAVSLTGSGYGIIIVNLLIGGTNARNLYRSIRNRSSEGARD